MKKSMKLLSLLLAVMMLTFAFTACEEMENQAGNSDEEAITQVIEAYGEALQNFDEEAGQEIAAGDIDLIGTSLVEGYADEAGIPEAVMFEWMAACYECIEITSIDNINVNGDEATAEMVIELPDMESLDFKDIVEGFSKTDADFENVETEEDLGEWLIKKATEIVAYGLKNLDTMTETWTVELVKDGNDWLIKNAG